MPIETLFNKTPDLIRYASNPQESARVEIQKVTSQLSELFVSARSGDEDAVELLINLSAGSHDSEVALSAQEALLQLYGDTHTLQSVRKAIASQACKLFEASEAAKAKKAAMSVPPRSDSKSSPVASSAPTFHLKVPVLYLAGQHAHESKYTELEHQINETLKKRCFRGDGVAEASGESDLLTRGRFVRSEELLAATRQLRVLPVHDQCLELGPPSGRASFTSQIHSIRDAVIKEKTPRAVFVNTGNHWVTLVLLPAKDPRSNLVSAVIVDTNEHAAPRDSLVRKAVGEALDQFAGQPVELFGGAMQTHVPNACGALSVWWVRALDHFITQHPNADIDALTTWIRQSVNDWSGLDSAAQDGRVTAIRAHLLATLGSGQSGT